MQGWLLTSGPHAPSQLENVMRHPCNDDTHRLLVTLLGRMKFPTALAAAGLIARASAFCPGHRPFSPAASRARRSASALRAGGAEEEGFMRMQPAPTTSGYGLGYTPTTPPSFRGPLACAR